MRPMKMGKIINKGKHIQRVKALGNPLQYDNDVATTFKTHNSLKKKAARSTDA